MCFAPSSKDPAACAACVSGATGVATAARPACFGCYLKTATDGAACNTCLAGAKSANTAGLCPLCSGGSGGASQKQCYSCMDRVQAGLPGVRWLCHMTGTVNENKGTPALNAAVPRYFNCLAAATTLEGGQGCRKCMDAIEKDGAKAGGACFAALKA
jgi:hypothetical protein